MATDQASKDRAIAVLLELAEDEGNTTEERAQAAQAVLMGDSFGPVPEPRGIDNVEADAMLRELVREAIEGERNEKAKVAE